MKDNDKAPYLPRVRSGYDPTDDELLSFASDGTSIHLTNPATDPIVVNNIAWQEFDYTESLADEGSTSLPLEAEDYTD